jgi:hypothetical protein
VNRGHNGPGTRHRLAERGGVTNITEDHLDQRPLQGRRAGRVPGQHPDSFAAGREPGDHQSAEPAGPPGDENHRAPRSCEATAESIEPPPGWTGSR